MARASLKCYLWDQKHSVLSLRIMVCRQVTLLLCLLAAFLAVAVARPDGGDTHPLPGPGLAYGGIPYGSMSGNVAEFFNRRASSRARNANYNNVDFAPIEQWLR